MALRVVKVERGGKFVVCRLKEVKDGEKVQINCEGTIYTGHAHGDGYEQSPGVGACRVTTDLFIETVSATNGKQTQ